MLCNPHSLKERMETLHRHWRWGCHLGAPVTSEHCRRWAMTIGEWNLHAKPLPVHMGIKEGDVHPGLC